MRILLALRSAATRFIAPHDPTKWLASQPAKALAADFAKNGHIKIDQLLDKEMVAPYRDLYARFIAGDIDASKHRHDLGNHVAQQQKKEENVCQIMWPSDYIPGILEGPLHQRTGALARAVLGEDCVFDFDMLIYKAPHTSTEVPWHQDQAYWLDMPDKRALSCWVALDDATVDNGCMWFVSGSHKQPLRAHRQVQPGVHVLMCTDPVEGGVPYPLAAGGCTFHHGGTLHRTGGNVTALPRRAYIVNYRPKAMVEWSRERGFDHGRQGLKSFADADAERAASERKA
eukprot:m.8146 g.8146  ORF g.8146 m.8146 type:complete len:286 (-) comp5176_c0_seq1:38-895(-)